MKKTVLSMLFVVFTILSLGTCSSDWKDDEAALTINLGGDARSAILWAGSDPSVLNDIIYKIQLTGNVEKRTLNTKGSNTISTTVSAGFWNVEVTAYYKAESFLYAEGIYENFEVKAGQKNTVTITMVKKYYNIGDTGPGGGEIFYCSAEGFIMTDTGEICHYLELAPTEYYDEYLDTPNWAISPYANTLIGGTAEAIGTGRNNTTRIVYEIGGYAPPADFCNDYTYNGLTDWFLPSKDEIYQLSLNKAMLSSTFAGDSTNQAYWSSTEFDNNQVYYQYIGTSDGYDSKGIYLHIRPIRAF